MKNPYGNSLICLGKYQQLMKFETRVGQKSVQSSKSATKVIIITESNQHQVFQSNSFP